MRRFETTSPRLRGRQAATLTKLLQPDILFSNIQHSQVDAVTMSGRLLSSRYATLARHSSPLALRSPYHTAQQRAGGLITRNSIPRSRPISSGTNTAVVRHASFARAIPKLAFKLIRLPAILGATAVGSLAYIQYQATRPSIPLCL